MVKGKDSRLLKTDRSSHDDSVERTISAKRAGSSVLWSDRCSTMSGKVKYSTLLSQECKMIDKYL